MGTTAPPGEAPGTAPTGLPGRPGGDQGAWAPLRGRLAIPAVPAGAVSLNVAGRKVAGPLQGFGQLWQKTYRVHLAGPGVSPARLMAAWREQFPRFWEQGHGEHFFPPRQGLVPGGIALINVGPPGKVRFGTGVLVLHADDESFTFMTPEGHPFAGWVTFLTRREGEGGAAGTVAEVQVLIRASDPLYELGMRLGALHRVEDATWGHTLVALAAHFGERPPMERQIACLDRRVQWSRARNLRHNAALRSLAYALVAPLRRGRASRGR